MTSLNSASLLPTDSTRYVVATVRPRYKHGLRSMSANPYGRKHATKREAAIEALVPGTPCPFCGYPMFKHQDLDLDHVTPVKYGGANGKTRLAHSHCNRSAGAKLKGKHRKRTKKRVLPKW